MTKPPRETLYELLYEKGIAPHQVAARFGVSYATLRKWKMEYALGAQEVAVHLAKEKRRVGV